ncbi:MAG: YggS family pyridoxal phosphate-dependent enzyme [Sebaldella sp.]|nr:YggS family pyridoxal phosphate-dependent enzyme [Sebaldella sp.]
MDINKEVILKNYEKVENDVKKYSPYPEKVKILFVTKYLNIEEHKKIIDMGFSYFGENKAQVFRDKLESLENETLKWDFIGRLQKNKIKYIIKHVNLIHSVDSISLFEEINKKASEINRIVNILIQVNVSNEETKTGFDILELENLFKIEATNVKIKGLMTMAPLIEDTEKLRSYFREVVEIKDNLNKKYNLELEELSMGMSNDYIEALKEGATIIRIGSKFFE